MITIIDRCEQKYFLTNDKYVELMNRIKEKLTKDLYFSETIYNIYFDNDNYELISRSLEKPEYKEKIRLRCYEEIKSDSKVFLEIKKKFYSHTNKRRVAMTYYDYQNYYEKGLLPNCDKQIMKEIDYCFKNYHLHPKIKIQYDRLSYSLKEDNNFRITFDNNVKYNFDIYEKCSDLLFSNGYIMEFKSFNGIPIWLNKILLELEIFPTSYSKVGKIFEKKGVI